MPNTPDTQNHMVDGPGARETVEGMPARATVSRWGLLVALICSAAAGIMAGSTVTSSQQIRAVIDYTTDIHGSHMLGPQTVNHVYLLDRLNAVSAEPDMTKRWAAVRLPLDCGEVGAVLDGSTDIDIERDLASVIARQTCGA